MKTNLQLKQEWKKYISEHPEWRKTINNHHYFRSRYASKFWLLKIEEIYNDVKMEIEKISNKNN